MIRIDSRCTACGACLATCPAGALTSAPGRPAVSAPRCTGCLECIEVCPRDAIAYTFADAIAEAIAEARR